MIRASEDDDINHLLLNCQLSSELGTGLRYAYSRLDIIDRKAAELFRSFTWAFGLLGALTALGSGVLHPRSPGRLHVLQIVIVICLVVLVPLVIGITLIHKSITNLHYYRISKSVLDADAVAAGGVRLTATVPAMRNYIDRISSVTVEREYDLSIMARLHSIGMGVCFALLMCLIAFAYQSPPAH